jgi:acetyl esterase/lipase
MSGSEVAGDRDPVEQQSSKVQCVAALYAPADLATLDSPFGSVTVTAFMGMRPPRGTEPGSAPEARLYREASPFTYVSPDDPPFLLIHGDEDPTVPFKQSETMYDALRKAGVTARLIRVPGGKHDAAFPTAREKADWPGEVFAWMEAHLRSAGK